MVIGVACTLLRNHVADYDKLLPKDVQREKTSRHVQPWVNWIIGLRRPARRARNPVACAPHPLRLWELAVRMMYAAVGRRLAASIVCPFVTVSERMQEPQRMQSGIFNGSVVDWDKWAIVGDEMVIVHDL